MRQGIKMEAYAFINWLFLEDNKRKVAWLIFCIALAVRFAGLAIVPEAHLSSNAINSIIGGASLIQSGQFVNNPDYPVLIPPLTALFTAAIQTVFGSSLLPIKIVQIILDAFMVVIVFNIGRLILPYTAAVIGGLLLTIYPFSVFVPLYIGTEALFTFFLALFMFFSIRALQEDTLALYFVAGLFLGIATLTRGTTLYFPLFFLAFLAWHNRKKLGSLVFKQSALFLLGTVLILAPWTVRNLIVLGAFIPASSSSMPLLGGSAEEFWEIPSREKAWPKYFIFLKEGKGIVAPANPTSVEKDQFYKRAAIEKYRARWEENPLSFVPFYAKKLTRLWYATESGKNHVLVLMINLLFYVFGLVGLWLLFRNANRLGYLIVVLLAYFVAVHLIVFAYFRYVIPVMPYIILLAGYGLMYMVQRYVRSFKTPIRE